MKRYSGALILLLLFSTSTAYAQNYFNNWYFGRNAGMTFSTNPPSPLPGGRIDADEGVACISDDNGNLLFYTDGITVFDRSHGVMPNGTGLTGNRSTSQSALIIPMPGSTTKYYLFTMTTTQGNGTLNYSIVDMSLNDGKGDIDPNKKNITLSTNQTEKLVAANSTTCGIWVITHQRYTNQFEARLVTSNGIGPSVYSVTGSAHNGSNLTGVMKVSANNKKIGLATLGQVIEVFDFDPATGKISNGLSLTMPTVAQAYGVCFSPDNSKIYVGQSPGTPGYDIFQFDLSSGDPATINASGTIIGHVPTVGFVVADMQAGPDRKIYCSRSGSSSLPVINNPDLPGLSCNFQLNGPEIGGTSLIGLPNEIRRITPINLELGNDTTLCPGSILTLKAPAASSWLWSTGETTSSIQVTADGKYWVRANNGGCEFSDTIRAIFKIPEVDLGTDTTVCQGQTVVLTAPINNGYTYAWSTGVTTYSINVTMPGRYTVKVSNGACSAASTINVAFDTPPAPELGNDIILCEGQQATLSAGVADSYLWSTGSTNPGINVNASGTYAVDVIKGKCKATDQVKVTVNPLPPVPFGTTSTICEQQVLKLDAGPGNNYVWSTGETSKTISIATPGVYSVKVDYYGACDRTYTTEVLSKACDCKIFMPTAFTPNGDGRNDVFKPGQTGECDYIRFEIFNRWGQKIYESKDISQGWNGDMNGIKQTTGIFVWQVTARKGEERVLLRGTVALIR